MCIRDRYIMVKHHFCWRISIPSCNSILEGSNLDRAYKFLKVKNECNNVKFISKWMQDVEVHQEKNILHSSSQVTKIWTLNWFFQYYVQIHLIHLNIPILGKGWQAKANNGQTKSWKKPKASHEIFDNHFESKAEA